MHSRLSTPVCGALILLCGAFAPAAHGQEGLVGLWEGELTFFGQSEPVALVIRETEDDAIQGRWVGRLRESWLRDIEHDGVVLRFVREGAYPGQGVDLPFTGKVENGALTGYLDTPRGPAELALTWVAQPPPEPPARVVEAPPPGIMPEDWNPARFLGEWTITLTYDGSEYSTQLEFAQDSLGRVSGVWYTPVGTAYLASMALDGNQFEAEFNIPGAGGGASLEFSGTLEGNSVQGALVGTWGRVPAAGSREGGAVSIAPELVGRWTITSESSLGTVTRELVVTEAGTGAYGAPGRTWPIEVQAGAPDELVFTVTAELGGQPLSLEFRGALEDGTLRGRITSAAGAAEVTGVRAQ